ncbi:MAG: radical SAM protein [Thermoprotei archaeon]|nr:MAG: radical SAM protein [Thermoprotei archaeon]
MKLVARFRGRYFIYVDDLPLVGHIAFGVIDRGTNVLQVRPTTVCPLNCIFCSVDAGPYSRSRQSEYIVDVDHLLWWVKKVYEFKGGEVDEALIDGVGDPMTYGKLPELVLGLKKIVKRVALETHGVNLTEKNIRALEEAGLDRINLSIDTLDPEKAKFLQGCRWYDVRKVARMAEFIARETSIDLHITPVWLPGLNDDDIPKIIEWGLSIGAGKRFPPFGIQKFLKHRHGRKPPGVREVSWSEFWRFLEELEKRFGVSLRYPELNKVFGIRRARRIPIKYGVGERVSVKVIAPGWLKNEVLAVDRDEDVLITVVGLSFEDLRRRVVTVRIDSCKDGIFIARRCRG